MPSDLPNRHTRPHFLRPPRGLTLAERQVKDSAAEAVALAQEWVTDGFMPRTYPATDDPLDYRWVAEAWDWPERPAYFPRDGSQEQASASPGATETGSLSPERE